MKKLLSVVFAVTFVVSFLAECVYADYPNSVSWGLRTVSYSRLTSTTVRINTNGNGYDAKVTYKSGTASKNMVRISCTTNSMTPVEITELNHTVILSPAPFYDSYIEFQVDLIYEGGDAYNSGTITGR